MVHVDTTAGFVTNQKKDISGMQRSKTKWMAPPIIVNEFLGAERVAITYIIVVYMLLILLTHIKDVI